MKNIAFNQTSESVAKGVAIMVIAFVSVPAYTADVAGGADYPEVGGFRVRKSRATKSKTMRRRH